MNLKSLNDCDLLEKIKTLVKHERQLLTQVLHHLAEVQRRKLFADLKYGSLFEYATKELKYSEAQAARRIQAVRLIQEVPEVEEKIASGALSLTNVSQAMSFFRENAKSDNLLATNDKRDILQKLENTSTREGQKVLLGVQTQKCSEQTENPVPAHSLKDRERIVSDTHVQVSIVITEELKSQLEVVRSLLGPKGASLSWAELLTAMADLSIRALQEKKFGKKRTAQPHNTDSEPQKPPQTPAPAKLCVNNPRTIPRSVRHQVWVRDHGKCSHCGSRRNLHYDHIQPIACGGDSSAANLRIVCQSCNLRAAIKVFGIQTMERAGKSREKR